jgi:hypothetical protein
MSQDLQAEVKKVYEAPSLTTINLRPEEAVLGACKSSSTSNQGHGLGGCGMAFAGCPNQGS